MDLPLVLAFLTVVFGVEVSLQSEWVIIDQDLALGFGPTRIQNVGPVYGARQCGGPGKFVEWRAEGCKTTDSTCQLPSDDERVLRGEIDIIPSQSIQQMIIRISTTIHGSSDPAPQIVVERPIQNSTVIAGVPTTLRGGATLKKVLSRKRISATNEIINAENNQVEICFAADFEIL